MPTPHGSSNNCGEKENIRNSHDIRFLNAHVDGSCVDMNMRKNPDMQTCSFHGSHTIRERETFKVPAFQRRKRKKR